MPAPAPWEMDWSKKKEEDRPPWERAYGPPPRPEKAPTAPTTLRDIGVAGASGFVGATKALTDVFGADSAASQALGRASTSLQEMYTPERQREMQYYQAKQQEAAKSGDITGEVGAALQGIKAAPLQGAVQAFGSLIPNLATLFIPGAGEARAFQISRGAINTAIGIMQGTGAVKGSIYEGVKQELIKSGLDEAEAARQAERAQSYLGPNADQILAGAVIGYGAGRLGAEQLLAPKGAATRKLAAIGSESVTEAIQGGQEQVAQNIALQRQGFNVPTFQGVAGAATQEGILGALGAGPVSLISGRPSQKDVPGAKPVTDAQVPLLLEGKGAFVPVGLPDGSVAMTRSDLAKYEEEKFRKKYAPQDVEREKALLGYEPFVPKVTPAGTVAMTAEDVKRAEARDFENKYAPVPFTAEEVEQAKLRERAETIPPGEFEPVVPSDIREEQKLEAKEAKGKKKTKSEIEQLEQEAKQIELLIQKNTTGKLAGKSLRQALLGKLAPSEVFDISPEKTFKDLKAKNRGTTISDLIEDGALNDWLPSNMQPGSETYDFKESAEYIKEKVRNKDYKEAAPQLEAQILERNLEALERQIAELKAPQELRARLAELSPEEAQAEADRLAREAGYLGQPRAEEVLQPIEPVEQPVEDEYYPDMDQVGLPAEAPAEAPAAPAQSVAPETTQVSQLASQWDRLNRTSRSQEWMAGAAEANPAFNSVEQEGANVPAHGMAKVSTLGEAVKNLLSILTGGIDATRTLYYDSLTNPRAGVGAGTGTAGGVAYRDGPFIITFREGLTGQPTSADITGVLVNPANAELVAPLQRMFPNLTIRSYDNVADVVGLQGRKPGTAVSAAETDIIEGQAREMREPGAPPTIGARKPGTALSAAETDIIEGQAREVREPGAPAGIEGRKPGTAVSAMETDIIEGQTRVIDEETIAPLVAQLSAPEQQTLAQHYGEEVNSPGFLAKVREDIVNFTTKGAQSVAAAIRNIIRKLQATVLAAAVILNPNYIGPGYQVAIPQNVTKVEQVLAQVPASVRDRMSPGAQQAYANILPAIQGELQKSNKLFILTDKPNARVFVFDANGQPILDKKVLLGLQTGDYYKGDTEIKANRFTPAGLFTMGLRDAKRGVTETGGDETKTAGDYDFGKVFVLDKAAPDGSYSITLFHSVYTKMSDAQARLRALAKDSAEDSRYSFGCINVDKNTYKFMLDNYEKQMDGAKLFIVPDNPNATMDFIRGKAVTAGDLSRQAAPEVTRTVTKTVPGTPSAAADKTQMAARKEEDQETRERGKYMQAKPGERGMTKAAVDRAVDAIRATWKNAPDIEVVQNISELPAEIQEDIARDKVNPRGVYDPTTKKVFLVADNIPNDAQAAITLAHEALGHFGLRVVLGQNFKPMMNQIYEGNKNVRERADAYMEEGLDRETAVEEVLSEMAQEVYDTRVPEDKLKPTRTALQKVMNAVRQFLARLGVPIKTIDDAAVLALIANARRSVVRGEGIAGEMAGGKSLYSARDRIERVAQRLAGQPKGIDEEAFAHVKDKEFYEGLKKYFNPQSNTIVDRLKNMREDFWQKLAQGVADQYRSIKDYGEKGAHAYILARMSKTIDGALEGALFHGHVKLTDGALDIQGGTKGLVKVLEPVGKEVDSFQIWMALNREQQLVREGKIPSIDAELVKKANELTAGTLNGKPRLEVYKEVRKDLNELNKSVLNVAREQGLITKEAYDTFAADINYIPFYRLMENGDIQGAATASGIARQEFSKKLKGGEKVFGDLMENTLRNWSHILSASMKNRAANATLEAAMEMNGAMPNMKVGFIWRDGKVYSSKSGQIVGDGKLKPEYTSSEGTGLVKTMIDGKPAYFDVVDPLLLDSISSIGYMGPKSKFLDVAKDFKNLLQFGVTLSPAFKVRNLFRDSISAMAVSDLERSPLANVYKGWLASDKNNPAHISALAGGAIFNFGSYYEGDQSRLIKRLLKQGVDPNTVLDTDEKIKKGLADAWNKYQEWGNKSEAANRMALYLQLKERGMSHLEASFYARDLLDFSMQGSWPAFRLVAQVVPFLNARVQGLYKLGRDGVIPTSRVLYNSVTGKPIEATDKQKAQQFGTVTSAVVLASMALYLMFKDDEEFQKREAWDRDNFWWFKLPGMESALRVPKPFEIGAFGTMSERVLEQIIDQGAEGKQFEESFRRMLGDTFALNPVPQVIKPLMDLYANKDSFTGAPIETAGMERLSKQERASDTTSPLAKALGGISSVMATVAGEKTELSPAQIDYAIKAYLGWLGGTITASSHYAVMPFSKSAYPDHNWTDTMSLGFVKSLPATQSRYVTEFYQNSKQISQAYADMRHYAELGEAEKVDEILAEKGDQIALSKSYDKAAKDMAKIRQVISQIRADEDMSGAEKKEEIDRLKLLIDEIAKEMETVRKELRE